MTALPGPGKTQEIIRRDLGVCKEDYNLRLQNAGGVILNFVYGLSGCTGENSVSGPIGSIVSADGWYHVVGEYDGELLTVHVGGEGKPLQLIGSQFQPGIAPPLSTQPIFIGKGVDDFPGAVDEVRISSVALY
jgi:hypothetical protein